MRVTDVIFLSFLWALVSAPLITIYPSTIALMDTIKEWDSEGTTGRIWFNFFTSFKIEFKKKLLISLFWIIIFGSIYMNYSIYVPIENQIGTVIVSLIFTSNFISIMFFFVSGLIWQQGNKDTSIKSLFSDSLSFIVSRPFRSVIVTIILLFLLESIITIPVLSFVVGIPIALLAVILKS